MKQIELLWSIITLLNSGKGPDEVFSEILKQISDITDASAATIWLCDTQKEYIVPFAYLGSNSEQLGEVRLAYGTGICGKCISTGETIFVEDCSKEEAWNKQTDKLTGFRTRTIITIPIQNEFNGVIGCIQLLNKKDNLLFNNEDAHTATIIAEQLGIWFQKNGNLGYKGTERELIMSLRNLKRYYGSNNAQVKALDDVSFDIRKGELLVILGSSGSGKSTLLNIIGGMDRASSGSAILLGKDICKFNEAQLTEYRKNSIGFVFQFYNLLRDLTALENVKICASLKADSADSIMMLKQVGLSEKLDKYPTELSGGEQQRVSIARALVKKADILLCDEPTGALDYETGRQILVLLEKLVREHGQTMVVVTHTSAIAEMADRVIRMKSGHLVDIVTNLVPKKAERVEW